MANYYSQHGKVTIDTREEKQSKPGWKKKLSQLMPAYLHTWLSRFKKKADGDTNTEPMSRFTFVPIGFHGDKYLLDVVDTLAKKADVFIETGTNVGSTLAYFARKYLDIPCLSCEPDGEAFQHAQQNLTGLSNVTLYNQTSQEFLATLKKEHLDVFQKGALFWLDAHGYGFQWPLKEELAFITAEFSQALILIDDFKVPGMEVFGYDNYEGQICSYEYIKDFLNPTRSYNIYYPNYTEHTSQYHPLCGWGLITFGSEKDLNFPEPLQEKIRRASN